MPGPFICPMKEAQEIINDSGAVPILKDPFHQVDSLERFNGKMLMFLLDVLSCLLL